MTEEKRHLKTFFPCILLFLVATIFTILIKFIDVRAIGPEGTSVGFASVNEFFARDGFNELWYKASEYLGYIVFAVPAFYLILAFVDLLKKKSFKKFNKGFVILGIFYFLVLLVYFIFENLALNYRPVLLDGELEASYPSSHTLLAVSICVSAMFFNPLLFKKTPALILDILLGLLMVSTIAARLLSGVHWFTDIVGGILIAAFLVSIFNYFLPKTSE